MLTKSAATAIEKNLVISPFPLVSLVGFACVFFESGLACIGGCRGRFFYAASEFKRGEQVVVA